MHPLPRDGGVSALPVGNPRSRAVAVLLRCRRGEVVRRAGGRGGSGAGRGLGLLLARGPSHRAASIVGVSTSARREAFVGHRSAGHPDRRRRGAGRRRVQGLPAHDGRDRGLAPQPRQGDRVSAPTRRRRGRRRRGPALALRRRRLRPGDQPTPGNGSLVGDHAGACNRWHLPGPTRRRRHQRRDSASTSWAQSNQATPGTTMSKPIEPGRRGSTWCRAGTSVFNSSSSTSAPSSSSCARSSRHVDMQRLGSYGRNVELLLGLTGLIVVVFLIAWRLRRSQRDVDEFDDAGYRPPPIHGQAGPH